MTDATRQLLELMGADPRPPATSFDELFGSVPDLPWFGDEGDLAQPPPTFVNSTRTTDGARIVLLKSPLEVDAAVEHALTWDVVGLDVETAHLAPPPPPREDGKKRRERLDFHRLALRSIQFGDRETVYVVDCALVDPGATGICRLLASGQPKVAHNAKFEQKVLTRHGLPVANLCCTMQSERVLFQGLLLKAPSLGELVAKYRHREMLKDVRDTFIEEREVRPLRPEQVRYAADDVDVLLPIHEAQLRQLEREGLLHVAELEWAVITAFANIELRGFHLDAGLWRDLLEQNTARRDKLHAELYQLFQPTAMKRWRALCDEREARRAELEAELAALPLTDPGREAVREELDKIPSWLKVRPNKETGEREPKKTAQWDFTKVLTSPMQLRQCFLQLGLELPDTSDQTIKRTKRAIAEADDLARRGEYVREELRRYVGVPADAVAALDRLKAFRTVDKLVTTYGIDWIDAISPVTGRIHAEYDTLKETARSGCSDKNVQNVPKRGDGVVFRRCFTAGQLEVVTLPSGAQVWVSPDTRIQRVEWPDGTRVKRGGTVYIAADYSQIELRVAAEFSGDPAMIKAFQSGEDFHAATAALMYSKPIDQVTKDERRSAKAVNFGILFGIGPAKLAEDISNDTGVPVSFERGKEFLTRYGKSFPVLMKWLKERDAEGRESLVSYTAYGHRRRFERPERPIRRDYPDVNDYMEACDKYNGRLAGIGRECKNTPVQGTAAVIAKLAILDLEELLPRYGAGIVAFIHDELVVECSEFVADEVAGVVGTAMETAGRRFMRKVPCKVDVEYGYNWLGEGLEDEEEAA